MGDRERREDRTTRSAVGVTRRGGAAAARGGRRFEQSDSGRGGNDKCDNIGGSRDALSAPRSAPVAVLPPLARVADVGRDALGRRRLGRDRLLGPHVAPADARDRARAGASAAAVQAATGETVEVALVDRVYAVETAAADAEAHGMRPEIVNLPGAKRGFVPVPRRWVGERSFVRASRIRRLARDDERPPETAADLHFVAFACRMLHRLRTVVV